MHSAIWTAIFGNLDTHISSLPPSTGSFSSLAPPVHIPSSLHGLNMLKSQTHKFTSELIDIVWILWPMCTVKYCNRPSLRILEKTSFAFSSGGLEIEILCVFVVSNIEFTWIISGKISSGRWQLPTSSMKLWSLWILQSSLAGSRKWSRGLTAL